MKPIALILTTLPDEAAGKALVETLHGRRLIACGHILPAGQSYFRWKGEAGWSGECTVVLKTSAELGPHVADALAAIHPYEIPEILVLPVQASDAYADWVEAETERERTDDA